MEKLVSIKEIEKEGYKPESKSTWIRGKNRMIKCGHCNCLFHSVEQENDYGKLIDTCFWCKSLKTVEFK